MAQTGNSQDLSHRKGDCVRTTLGFISPAEAAVHVLLIIAALAVLAVSSLAFFQRRGKRYFFLMLAFAFLTLSQMIGFVESFYFDGYLLIPYIDVHLSHFVDLAMLASFAAALLAT